MNSIQHKYSNGVSSCLIFLGTCSGQKDEGAHVPTRTTVDFNLSSGPSVFSDHDVSTSSSHSYSQSLDSSKPNTMVNQKFRDSQMEMEELGSDDNRRVAKRLSDNESPSNSPGKRHKTDSVENIHSIVNKVAIDDPAGATSLNSEAKEEVLASGKHPTGEEMHSDTSGKRTKHAHGFEKERSSSDGDEDIPNEHKTLVDKNENSEAKDSGKHSTGEGMHSDTSEKRAKPVFEKERSSSDGDGNKPNEHKTLLDENRNSEAKDSGKHSTGEEMHSDTSVEKERSSSDGDGNKPNEHKILLDEKRNIVSSSEGNEGASTTGVLQPTVDSSSENKDNSITFSPERHRRAMSDGAERKDNKEDTSMPVQKLPMTSFSTNDLNKTNGQLVTEKPSTHFKSPDTSSKNKQPTDGSGSNEHPSRKRTHDESTVTEPPLKKGVECTEESDPSQLSSEKTKIQFL